MNARRKLTIVGAGAAAALAAASIGWAAIPDGGGVIHGCYDNVSGSLRVFDSAGGNPKGCGNKETALSWNQQGQPGALGPQGPAGPQGSKGDTGATEAFSIGATTVLKMRCGALSTVTQALWMSAIKVGNLSQA